MWFIIKTFTPPDYNNITRHPDKNPGDETASQKYIEISTAYTVLSDEEKRRNYDQYGTDDPNAGKSIFTGFSNQIKLQDEETHSEIPVLAMISFLKVSSPATKE